MADRRKSLDEIRPARRVSVKGRNQAKPHRPKKPRVIQNAKPYNPREKQEAMDESAAKIVADLKNAEHGLMEVMKEFNQLLNTTLLSENRSIKDRETEHSILARLANSALDVEALSPPKGIMALCILAIRQALSLRDAGNALAYKVDRLEKRVKVLEEKNEEEG